ncbi:Pectin lyase fold/virulence factor [Sesbania bispinosa]|nr:Pectin lyase fold/virulence factor [Sesbania bispinosa]
MRIKNSQLIGTTNGLRIKSWPDRYPGGASEIIFSNITMENVKNPIIIDQEYQCDPDCKKKGETLFHIAARYGHSRIAKLLIEHVKAFPANIENGIGAEIKFIRATNNENDIALHEAVRYHQIEVVEILLEMDPNNSYYANNSNETPLYLASERNIRKL